MNQTAAEPCTRNPHTPYSDSLDKMCQQFARLMPEDGTRYRIGYGSKEGKTARIEIWTPDYPRWRSYREGIAYIDRTAIYWTLAHMIETLPKIHAEHRAERRDLEDQISNLEAMCDAYADE